MADTIEVIEAIAIGYFDDISPAHDWSHVKRVSQTAKHLTQAEEANGKTVEMASLLHDIGRCREDQGDIDNHAAWWADEAESILLEFDVSEGQIAEVTHCIRAHQYSIPPEPCTLEAKVLSDADNLGALGAIGIARTFTYGGDRGNPISIPEL